MGWTSKPYRGNALHTSLTAKQAFEFLKEEFYEHDFAAYHFHKANDKYDHNECYVIMRSRHGGKPFICVILIDIKNGEIYWKEIPECMGPSYTNCPSKFFTFVTDPGDHATQWRIECNKNNVSFKPIVEYYD